jgi:hypothetical protein
VAETVATAPRGAAAPLRSEKVRDSLPALLAPPPLPQQQQQQ